ncbi:MAG: DUF998 domain-containing protein [Candidatus Saccharimonadales bacterium]
MNPIAQAATFWRRMDILAVFAGIIYASWPLGYWLNPGASSRGLASELEGVHQPYNWVFIVGDILSSLLITLVCWLIWRRLRGTHDKKLLEFALFNIVLFAAGTVIDAALPLRCEPTIQVCPNFMHDPLLLAHGLFSIQAALCLFISLAILWWHRRHTVLLNSLVIGYLLFSLFSLIAVIKPGLGNLSQHYYLALCGVWLALLPSAVRRTVGD